MAKKDQKSEGPMCACGKVDLYEESLKNRKNNKGEDTDLTSSNSADYKNSLPINANEEDQKSTKTNMYKE